MTNKFLCLLIIMFLPIAGVQAASNEFGQKGLAPRSSDVHVSEIAETEKKIAQLLRMSKTFEQLASQPHPKGLKKDQIKEGEKYDCWLREKSSELKRFVGKWRSAISRLNSASQQMQEMQMSFNLQLLKLQNKMSHENRQFTMVSNIMKNKHDTAKNSINNIR